MELCSEETKHSPVQPKKYSCTISPGSGDDGSPIACILPVAEDRQKVRNKDLLNKH